jgi:hypothetical protein
MKMFPKTGGVIDKNRKYAILEYERNRAQLLCN